LEKKQFLLEKSVSDESFDKKKTYHQKKCCWKQFLTENSIRQKFSNEISNENVHWKIFDKNYSVRDFLAKFSVENSVRIFSMEVSIEKFSMEFLTEIFC